MKHELAMTTGTVVIRGGGDIGTGVAHRLYRSGFDILILEIEKPLVIRRKVAFAQAVFDGQTVVEGVKAVKACNRKEIETIWGEGNIPIIIDPHVSMVREVKSEVLVDARLAKRATDMYKGIAPLTIALGPGFKAGKDVDVVIETYRGHNLGKVILDGYAKPNTGIPGAIDGYGEERVLRAPCDGKIRNLLDIGDEVTKGETVCYIDNEAVRASIDGIIRGITLNGMNVAKDLKIGDIDPRGVREYCFTISDKARAIGGGVLEAILYLKGLK